jgi:hypothetical protein
MKRIVFMLFAIFSLQAQAQFSAFEIVTPDTQDMLNEEIKSLSVEKTENRSFLVKVPEFRFKHVWLITCSWELADDQKELRSNIWKSDKGDRHVEVSLQSGSSPVQICEKDDVPAKDGFVEIILSDDLMSRSYIYIDYAEAAFDGGYYYNIDLPAYLRQINAGEN